MEHCTVILMQEGYNNIQHEEVVTAQEANEDEQYTILNVSHEFEESIYEVEVEDEVIYEESLPVYEAVTVYEEIVENTKAVQKISYGNHQILKNQSLNTIPSVNSSEYKNKVKPIRLPSISKQNYKIRTFEKNKKVKKLKNICEGALSINIGVTADKKNMHKCFLCDKSFIGFDRHVSKANVIKHITKYHLTGKIATKQKYKQNKKKYFGFVGSLQILAKNALICSFDQKNHKCVICNKNLSGIKSFVMKHIDIHLYKNKEVCKQTRTQKRDNLYSFGYCSDED